MPSMVTPPRRSRSPEPFASLKGKLCEGEGSDSPGTEILPLRCAQGFGSRAQDDMRGWEGDRDGRPGHEVNAYGGHPYGRPIGINRRNSLSTSVGAVVGMMRGAGLYGRQPSPNGLRWSSRSTGQRQATIKALPASTQPLSPLRNPGCASQVDVYWATARVAR